MSILGTISRRQRHRRAPHRQYATTIARRNPTGYTPAVITSFAHKGLEDFFYNGSKRGIQPRHAQRLADILDRLDAAQPVSDMRYPGSGLHPSSAAARHASQRSCACVPRTASLSNPRGPTGERRRRTVALLQEHPEGLSPVQTRQLLGLEKSLGSTCRST